MENNCPSKEWILFSFQNVVSEAEISVLQTKTKFALCNYGFVRKPSKLLSVVFKVRRQKSWLFRQYHRVPLPCHQVMERKVRFSCTSNKEAWRFYGRWCRDVVTSPECTEKAIWKKWYVGQDSNGRNEPTLEMCGMFPDQCQVNSKPRIWSSQCVWRETSREEMASQRVGKLGGTCQRGLHATWGKPTSVQMLTL